MSTPIMKCGHAANATNKAGKPVCVICIGIVAGADVIDESPPDLTGRVARCSYYGGSRGCKSEVPSSPTLAFFEYNATGTIDHYYCGCYGWD